MINKFFKWYETHYTQISWFLLGWLTLAALDDFARSQWGNMSLNLGFIALNYFMYSRRL